jgi:cytochrome c-type biogenesis protein CcmE
VSEVASPAAAAPPRAAPRRRNRRLAIAALVVAGVAFLAVTFGGIGKNLVYYWGPTELHAAGDRAVGATIRLGGQVAPGSVTQVAGASGVEFDVVDRKGGRVHVKSAGVPPQMFRESIGVVVEGTMTRDGHFAGTRLMVSHGNEYRVPSEGEVVDVREAMKSTKGLEGEKIR